MSIVKDLLLLFLFVLLVYKYIKLRQKLLNERNYFINTLSHDLRVSAIAQIRGLDFLLKNFQFPENSLELLSDINSSCRFSLDMMTMLLNSYKIKNGEYVLNYEYFNLNDLVSFHSEDFLSMAREKNIKISQRMTNSVNICADKTALSKVISILLATSINNADNKSIINILAKNDEQNCEISIIYQGKSLTDEEHRRMFAKESTFSTVGHGIKMHLCKKIIEFHNGKIFVKKYTKNLNSFTFVIPLVKKEKKIKTLFLSTFHTVN